MKRTWIVVAALTLAAFASAQVDPSKVVATVNGDQITGNEYYHRMEFMPGVTMLLGGQRIESTPGFFAIAQLIGERLLYQLAKEKGCLPTDKEIDDELASRVADNSEFTKDLISRGLSEQDVRNIVKHDLTNFKLQTFGVTVTDQEVQDHYKKNPKEFTRSKQLHIRLIAVKTDAEVAAVDADLKAGKSFADVAKTRSIDVTKTTGGDMGTVPIDYFAGQVQEALNGAKIGSTTAWLPVGSGAAAAKVKYQVVEITPAALLPLDKKLMTTTRRLMMLRASQGKVDIKKEVDDMRIKSKVVITLPQFQELWNEMNGIG